MEAVGSISTMITLAPINAHVTEKMSPHTVTERVENVHLEVNFVKSEEKFSNLQTSNFLNCKVQNSTDTWVLCEIKLGKFRFSNTPNLTIS